MTLLRLLIVSSVGVLLALDFFDGREFVATDELLGTLTSCDVVLCSQRNENRHWDLGCV